MQKKKTTLESDFCSSLLVPGGDFDQTFYLPYKQQVKRKQHLSKLREQFEKKSEVFLCPDESDNLLQLTFNQHVLERRQYQRGIGMLNRSKVIT